MSSADYVGGIAPGESCQLMGPYQLKVALLSGPGLPFGCFKHQELHIKGGCRHVSADLCSLSMDSHSCS